MPDTVLDVVVGDQLFATELSALQVTPSKAPQWKGRPQETLQVTGHKEVAATRRNPAYGLEEEAMANYNHIDYPTTNPSLATAPQTLSDTQSLYNNPQELLYTKNTTQPRAPQDHSAAATKDITQIMISASLGVKDAQLALGDLYMDGRGVHQDYQLAMDWYLQAAEQGHPVAQRRLGNLYHNGHGVSRDDSVAMEWYLRAADQKDSGAQFNIGNAYYCGRHVPQDYSQAMVFYLKAADQGHMDAQYNIGHLYRHGQGVPQDFARAMAWYLKAASQGYALAQLNIGDLYHDGD
ncbi:hypothetical protein BGX29_011221, partial [Mortierella sp. GBA35]